MGKTLKMFIEILLIFCMLSDGMTDNDNFTETWEYKGCFEDQTGSSIINSTRFNLGSNNTIQTCVHSCNEENYRYSGLKVGNCFCGHDYVRSNRRSDNSCNSSCPGDPQEICGRQWDRLSLYHIWDNSSTSAPSTEVTAWENISVPLTSFMLLQSTTTRSDKTDKSSTSAPSTEVTAWENARVSLTSFLLLQSTTIYSLTLSDKPDKTDVSLLAVYISVPVIITIAAVIAVITIFKIRRKREVPKCNDRASLSQVNLAYDTYRTESTECNSYVAESQTDAAVTAHAETSNENSTLKALKTKTVISNCSTDVDNTTYNILSLKAWTTTSERDDVDNPYNHINNSVKHLGGDIYANESNTGKVQSMISPVDACVDNIYMNNIEAEKHQSSHLKAMENPAETCTEDIYVNGPNVDTTLIRYQDRANEVNSLRINQSATKASYNTVTPANFTSPVASEANINTKYLKCQDSDVFLEDTAVESAHTTSKEGTISSERQEENLNTSASSQTQHNDRMVEGRGEEYTTPVKVAKVKPREVKTKRDESKITKERERDGDEDCVTFDGKKKMTVKIVVDGEYEYGTVVTVNDTEEK